MRKTFEKFSTERRGNQVELRIKTGYAVDASARFSMRDKLEIHIEVWSEEFQPFLNCESLDQVVRLVESGDWVEEVMYVGSTASEWNKGE